MPKIKVKGVIISNEYKWLYDLFEYDSTCPQDIETVLDSANGEDVELMINSGGGDVYAGSEIYTMLKEYKGMVVGKIVGVAASAAGVIGMGCKKLVITPTGQLMIHNVASGARGDYRDMQHSAEVLKGWNVSIANAYQLKTGLEQKELLALMNKETWLTAQQALDMNFVDEVMFDTSNQLVAAATNNSELDTMIPSKILDKLRASGVLKDRSLQALFNNNMKGVTPMPSFTDVVTKLPQEEQDLMNTHIAEVTANVVTEATASITIERDELLNKVATLESEVEAALAAAPEAVIEDPLVNASPEIKALVASAQAEATKAKADLQKIENQKQLDTFANLAGSFDRLPINAVEFGPIFMNFANADATGFKKLEALLTAANTAIETGKLFDNIGDANAVTGSALDQLTAKAATLMASNAGMTKEKAFANVCEKEAALYTQYLRERNGDE